MPEYEYHHRTFDKDGGTIDIPEEAVGLAVDYFGDLGVVQYLTPVEKI